MVNPAAFLAYTCSALLLLPRGKIWGSHAHFLHQNRLIPAKRAGSLSPCRFWYTQHYNTISIIAEKTCSWRHVCFKLRGGEGGGGRRGGDGGGCGVSGNCVDEQYHQRLPEQQWATTTVTATTSRTSSERKRKERGKARRRTEDEPKRRQISRHHNNYNKNRQRPLMPRPQQLTNS